jgi:hypothetical protein
VKKSPTNAELRHWARTVGRFSEQELFDADGKGDSCDECCELDELVRKGTPMVCYRASYEYEEYDTKCVRHIYDDTRFWARLTEAEVQEMLKG